MFKTFNIPHGGDLYEITVDGLGDIIILTIYRDNCNAIGERIAPEDIPNEVYSKLQDKISKHFKHQKYD